MAVLTMHKFISKPAVIEAVRIEKSWPTQVQLDHLTDHAVNKYDDYFTVLTLEGRMKAKYGDWLIRGLVGEYYACDDLVFNKKYEPLIANL